MKLKVYDLCENSPPFRRITISLCDKCIRELSHKPGTSMVRLYLPEQHGTCYHCESE